MFRFELPAEDNINKRDNDEQLPVAAFEIIRKALQIRKWNRRKQFVYLNECEGFYEKKNYFCNANKS